MRLLSLPTTRVRWLIGLATLMFCLTGIAPILDAQNFVPVPGDPPVASRIQISAPDRNGVVTITGEQNAVFGTAYVTIRNLYTGDIVWVRAGVNGGFAAQIYGVGRTPFWISPMTENPNSLTGTGGSLPGGPGTIIWSNSHAQPDFDDAVAVTQLRVDGSADDWAAYPAARINDTVFGLANAHSLTLAIAGLAEQPQRVVLVLQTDRIAQRITIDMQSGRNGQVEQIQPTTTAPQNLIVARQFNLESGVLEMRILRSDLGNGAGEMHLAAVVVDGQSRLNSVHSITNVNEFDGILYANGLIANPAASFDLSGSLGDGYWQAAGRIDALNVNPGQTVNLQLDFTLPSDVTPDELHSQLILLPLAAAAMYTNNGWSNMMTPTGLAIDNVSGHMVLEEVSVRLADLVQLNDTLLAGMEFSPEITSNIPPGRYTLAVQQTAVLGDESGNWREVLGDGVRDSTLELIPLPLTITVGDVAMTEIPWAFLYDSPSNGVRGLLAVEQHDKFALSGRVKFPTSTYILPPGSYPIEPYLPSIMPNRYDRYGPPFIPLDSTTGELQATIIRPDGQVDELPAMPILQNQLSTTAADERTQFGLSSPVDVYRLTTLDDAYTSYVFDDYGEYTITLTGHVDDFFGNRFVGGGTYHLVIAEPLNLLPGMLPGTPLEIGDVPFLGGRIQPGLAAQVTASLRIMNLAGDESQTEWQMTAGRYGDFRLPEPVTMTEPGEYLLDYDARFVDAAGVWWAGSLRSSGVIVDPSSPLTLHGKRGVVGELTADVYHSAWYRTEQYLPFVDGEVADYFPYQSGDVLLLPDNASRQAWPAASLQDNTGGYRQWWSGTVGAYRSADGISIDELGIVQELPLQSVTGGALPSVQTALRPDLIVNQGYSYISAVRPGLAVQQMVLGGDQGGLPLDWSGHDPLNGQIGSGADGLEPGDAVFLFGGARVINPEAGLNTTLGYAALAVMTSSSGDGGVFPPYRGEGGGLDSGALLTVGGISVDLYFQPTGIVPGQVIERGSSLVLAGHAAPPRSSTVRVVLTAPDGQRFHFDAETNAYGYLHLDDADFVFESTGVWTVEIAISGIGMTSVGPLQSSQLVGGVLGAENYQFNVFVVDPDVASLTWDVNNGDVDRQIRATIPTNFEMNIPLGWQDVDAHYVVTTPSLLLAAGSPRVASSVVTYQLNRNELAAEFSNIEPGVAGTGASVSDPLTLTLVITGTDSDGNRAIRVRSFTIFHDRLMSFEDVNDE